VEKIVKKAFWFTKRSGFKIQGLGNKATPKISAILSEMMRKSCIFGNPKIGGVFAENQTAPKQKRQDRDDPAI
jgi:hypothetical protein